MIALGLCLGVSKRELLEDYYPDELPAVLRALIALRKGERQEEQTDDVMEFLNM